MNTYVLRIAALLSVIALSGCGKPLMYHFKHYHRPFAAIAKSNQTYFHSQQTGRIIEKDPCATYNEPGCYGYEPTTWTHWPSQCPGSFPVQGEVVVNDGSEYNYSDQVMQHGEVISDGVIMESPPTVPVPADGAQMRSYDSSPQSVIQRPRMQGPTTTAPVGAPERDPINLPADVESAIPSPSDGANLKLPQPRIAAVQPIQKNETKLPVTVLDVEENRSDVVSKVTPNVQRLPSGNRSERLPETIAIIETNKNFTLNKPQKTIASKLIDIQTDSLPVADAKKASSRQSSRKKSSIESMVLGSSRKKSLSATLSEAKKKVPFGELKAADTKPVVTNPVVIATKPMVTKPLAAKPIVIEPTTAKPIVTKPLVSKPLVKMPSAAKPSAEDTAKLGMPLLRIVDKTKSAAKPAPAKKLASLSTDTSLRIAKQVPTVAKPTPKKRTLSLNTSPITSRNMVPQLSMPAIAEKKPVSQPLIKVAPQRQLAVAKKVKAVAKTKTTKQPKLTTSEVVIKDKSSIVAKKSVPALATKPTRGVVTMTVSDSGDSTLKFSAGSGAPRKPVRLSTSTSDSDTSVRFR